MASGVIPVIDISPLQEGGDTGDVAAQIRNACVSHGFMYIVGHGVPLELCQRLETLSQEFFALPEEEKLEISMAKGGRAWRGFFKLEGELTSGIPDQKSGIYFGQELSGDHPAVAAKTPLHGRNLFPTRPAGLKEAVLDYMKAVEAVGHVVLEGVALSLGLPVSYFAEHYTKEPLVLFRIFSYPRDRLHASGEERFGVGEHTDYGLLTLLRQDDCGGLEVKSPSGWIAAPPIPESFVVNIGDMLERLTGGLYKSTPHRVRNSSGRDRVSFPLFFDPNWSAEVRPIQGLESLLGSSERIEKDKEERWDKASVHEPLVGTYGEYLLKKVGKVFPELSQEVL